MKSSVALIGFMGTGKTATARLLAEKLGKEFIELDAMIEAEAGMTIAEIFERFGEIDFREREIRAVKEVADREAAVIACGGGVVLNRINIDRLRRNSVIVYLTAAPEVILRRTMNDAGGRPLLDVPDRLRQIKELLRLRRPYYERSADITIGTSRLKVPAVVERIIERLREYESQYQKE